VWDGTNYFAVWQRGSLDRYGYGTPNDVYGARITAGGTVLDPSGISISTAPSDQTAPSVTFGGGEYLVTWADARSGAGVDVYGSRVSLGGSVLDPSGLAIATSQNATQVAAASDGSGFLAVWANAHTGGSDLYAARVSADGQVLDPTPIPVVVPGSASAPAVQWDGTTYMVVWQDFRSGTDDDIYGGRVASDGRVLDGSGVPVSTAPEHSDAPSLVRDGAQTLAVWFDSPTAYPLPGTPAQEAVFGVHIANGAPVEPPIHLGTGMAPAVGFNGGQYLVAWGLERFTKPGPNPPNGDVYAVRLTETLAALDVQILPT
jgi:hypothetical protein